MKTHKYLVISALSTLLGAGYMAQAEPPRDGAKAITKDMPEEITDADNTLLGDKDAKKAKTDKTYTSPQAVMNEAKATSDNVTKREVMKVASPAQEEDEQAVVVKTKPPISDLQASKYDAAFKAMDANNDGMISRTEFSDWQGYDSEYAPRFDAYDTDDDSEIVKKEYVKAAKTG